MSTRASSRRTSHDGENRSTELAAASRGGHPSGQRFFGSTQLHVSIPDVFQPLSVRWVSIVDESRAFAGRDVSIHDDAKTFVVR
jgi:hypothetical protein